MLPFFKQVLAFCGNCVCNFLKETTFNSTIELLMKGFFSEYTCIRKECDSELLQKARQSSSGQLEELNGNGVYLAWSRDSVKIVGCCEKVNAAEKAIEEILLLNR